MIHFIGRITLVLVLMTMAPVTFACNSCVKDLNLSNTQWECLAGQLPKLVTRKGPMLIVKIDPENCTTQPTKRTHKSGEPSSIVVAKNPKKADTVFFISKSDIVCLEKNINSIVESKADERFIFEERCTSVEK